MCTSLNDHTGSGANDDFLVFPGTIERCSFIKYYSSSAVTRKDLSYNITKTIQQDDWHALRKWGTFQFVSVMSWAFLQSKNQILSNPSPWIPTFLHSLVRMQAGVLEQVWNFAQNEGGPPGARLDTPCSFRVSAGCLSSNLRLFKTFFKTCINKINTMTAGQRL